MRTILQEKETIHCNITIWYTNLFLCFKPWRFPHQKQQWINNERNLKRFRCGTWQKSEVNQRWSMKQGWRAQKFILPHWFSNHSSRSHGYHIQTARVRRTSSWRSICSYPGKNGRCSKIIENSKIGVSRHLDSSTTTQIAEIIVQYGRSSRNSWAKYVRSSFGRPIMGKAIWDNPFDVRLGEGFQLGMLIRTPWKVVILICVDDVKLAGKKENINPMWQVLNKEVALGEPTSFLDHENLACTQRQWEISKDSVDNYRTMFESRISAGATEKLSCSENLRISSWSYDVEGHAKKCVERYCELANKTTQQLYKVSTPCIEDHHFKEEELKSVGLSKVCSQIVLKCLYLACVGRPDMVSE